ncbi:MAG: ABC transporter substrate-binding protein [Kiritimatiellae bacterium]|nr:ABC transporter substrate-binding protein [Kiritimatiellia bacterium]
MRHTRSARLVCAAALAAALATSARPEEAPRLPPIRLLLQWTPQSQFAGCYVAMDKGIYRKHGLDVAVLRGGPDRDSVAALLNGEAEFATLWLTAALLARDRAVPLVHLGQVVNRSNLALVAWKDRGISTMKDLDGRKVAIWEGQFRPAYLTYFKARNVAPVIIPQYYSINIFLRRGVDACSVMYYNEYDMVYQAGVEPDELTTFFLSDLEFPLPEDGLYCLEAMQKERPDACRALAAATMEGWRYAAEHPEEALDIVMKYVREAHVPTNRLHMKWMLDKILASVFPSAEDDWRPGVLSESAYTRTAVIMRDAGMIGAVPPFESFSRQEVDDVP